MLREEYDFSDDGKFLITKKIYDHSAIAKRAKLIRDNDETGKHCGNYQVAATVPNWLVEREFKRGKVAHPLTQDCLMHLVACVQREMPELKLTEKSMV